MIPNRRRPSRGLALLFVLAAIALAVPVCLGLARTVTTASLDRSLRHDEQVIEDLALEADAPIVDWLTQEADRVVLRPDSAYPTVLVLDEAIGDGDRTAELRIVAWDQCGLTPLALATSASHLRLALPRDVVRTLEACRRQGDLPGLDWFTEEDEEGAFPPAANVQHVEGGTRLAFPGSTARTVGAWIATHNTSRLNVSTAPIPTVEAALRDLGRGGIDRIVAARREGELAPIPPAGTDQRPEDEPRIELVSTSDCWSFRVDAHVGRVRRSWWLTYQPGEARWRCVQRLLITTG